MPIDPDSCDPVRLAQLAHLRLDDTEVEIFTGQLRAMISDFNRIGGLDTGGVEPFAQPGDPKATLRRDEPAESGANAGHLSVPLLDHRRDGGQQ